MNHYVYKIILDGSDKYYIGRRSTKKEPMVDAYMGSGRWVKSIKDKFRLSKIVLEVFDTFNDLLIGEEKWIIEHFEDPNNMNVYCNSMGFGSGHTHPHYGKKFSEETCNKISLARTGKTASAETKKKLSEARSGKNNPMYGRTGVKSPHWGKTGVNSPSYGTKASVETKQKMSEAQSGKNNPMYGTVGDKSPNWGTKRTSETRKKISDSHAGENSYSAKVTEFQVLEIRKMYSTKNYTQNELGIIFAVARTTIGCIINKKTWKNI